MRSSRVAVEVHSKPKRYAFSEVTNTRTRDFASVGFFMREDSPFRENLLSPSHGFAIAATALGALTRYFLTGSRCHSSPQLDGYVVGDESSRSIHHCRLHSAFVVAS